MRRRSSLSSRSNFRCSTSSTVRPVQFAHHRLAALMPARRPSRYIAAATIATRAQPPYNSARRTESDKIAPRLLQMPAQPNQPVLPRRRPGAFPSGAAAPASSPCRLRPAGGESGPQAEDCASRPLSRGSRWRERRPRVCRALSAGGPGHVRVAAGTLSCADPRWKAWRSSSPPPQRRGPA